MIDKIRETVGLFLQTSPDDISDNTIIDRSGLGSSVLVHRMYAKLAEAGYPVENYHDILSFGDLVKKLNGETGVTGPVLPFVNMTEGEENAGIGIDIELVESMPICDDFREDQFYIRNFTPGEISHCILASDPYASFAGLFAAKEAIFKAGGFPPNVPFSRVEIRYSADGRPQFNDVVLSVSHTPTLAVAVAYRQDIVKPTLFSAQSQAPQGSSSLFKVLAVLALLLSIVSLLMLILR